MMVCLIATAADAKVKVLGKGEQIRFDPAVIPANMKPGYDVMNTKCMACHSLERVVLAITSGIAPVTGQPFDRMATKSYGIKMLRKPNSNMSRDDIKAIISFMNYLLDEAVRQ